MLESVKNSPNYKYWAVGALSIGLFGSVVDHGSVNIALPSVASDFSTDLATIQWVVIGYALTISALLLPMGRLGDMVGRTRVYILGTLIFAAAAALAATAPNLQVLVLARIIQGVGAAMSQGTGMAILISTFPEGERGKALGLMMTIVGCGAIAGPSLGGLLVGTFGWEAVFLFNLPLGLLAVTASLAILDRTRSGDFGTGLAKGKFDWLGAALSAAALLAMLVAITNGPKWGWTSPTILGSIGAFVVLLTAFIWWQLKVADPLLDLRLFQRRVFSLGVSSAFLTFLGSSAVLFLTPFYLQQVLGYSPTQAGLVVAPAALCIAVLGPISGRLSDRYGWRIFTTGGLGIAIAGILLLSTLDERSSLPKVMSALVLHSIGMGSYFSPNTSSVMSAVERTRFGAVSAFTNLVRNGANVTSVAMATVIVTATMASMGLTPSLDAVQCAGGAGGGDACEAFTTGLQRAYWAMAGLLAASFCISAVRGGKSTGLSTGPGVAIDSGQRGR